MVNKMLSKNRVFLFGIDALDWPLLNNYVSQGLLPNFEKLIKSGVGSCLTSTMPPITGSAWSSMVTGKNPGKHGIFDFFYRKKDSYNMVPINSSDRHGKALWDILSEYRKKVIIVNVPGTFPPNKVNGILISGKLTPSEQHVFTYPPQLSETLRKRGYIIHMREIYSEGNKDAFLKDVFYTVDVRSETMLNLMKEYDWDFFMINFDGVDEVEHWYWDKMDDRRTGNEYRDAIQRIYQKMDSILEKIIATLDEETTILVASDHGAGPQYGLIHLNQLLLKQGFIKIKDDVVSRLKLWMFTHGFCPHFAYNLITKIGLENLVGRRGTETRERSRRWLKRLFLSFENVDWPKTKAYSYGMCGAVYLNLKGREPEGSVNKGDEYEVRNDIATGLVNVQIPEKRHPLIKGVAMKEELYWGPYLDRAPEFFIIPDETYSAFGDFEFFSNSTTTKAPQTGFHRLHGVIILNGKMFRKGITLHRASIVDVAPIVLWTTGLPIPSDMDGHPPHQAIEPSYIKAKPVSTIIVKKDQTNSEKYELSKEEEDILKKRLRDLGYL
jgi:predicted AlkP superfamily phosphohydrolase/phosphomutase